ncbi:MAG TPA: hypothetical protein VJN43_10075 [Bryobacteraceae bacterium]|nr:hypothetical protein [Bryobacteraceae bacterium]
MLKRIGLSLAAICAAAAFVRPPTAMAADGDDYNRSSYSYYEGRNAHTGAEHSQQFRNDRDDDAWRYNRDRWREHAQRERTRRNHRDRDDGYRYNSYER